jgi:hypothetical protein
MSSKTIFDVFQPGTRGLADILAAHLCIGEILNLSLTCRAFFKVFWVGDHANPGYLLRFCERCDGSSGRAWKSRYIEKLEIHNNQKEKATAFVEKDMDCQLPSHGRIAIKRCQQCDRPVCKACRAQPDYTPLVDVDISGEQSRWDVLKMYRPKFHMLYHWRWNSYCSNCEETADLQAALEGMNLSSPATEVQVFAMQLYGRDVPRSKMVLCAVL